MKYNSKKVAIINISVIILDKKNWSQSCAIKTLCSSLDLPICPIVYELQ